jgi:hypothetical protein
MKSSYLKYLLAFFAGLTVCYLLFVTPLEPTVITVTETTSDTVYVQVIDTVHVTRTEIIHEQIRDTVLIEPIKPIISSFKASKPFLYGNTYVKGEVLGEVLKMDITNDFRLPTVTNTIETTNTIIKKPTGIYAVGGVNQATPYIGGIFVRDRWLVGLNTQGFQVGWKVR